MARHLPSAICGKNAARPSTHANRRQLDAVQRTESPHRRPAVPPKLKKLTSDMTTKHPSITVDDLWKFDRVGGISLSPDGAQAVCSVGSYSVDDNIGRTSLWLLSTLGGAPRRLTHCGDKDGQPRWSPKGDRIAFIAKREQQGKKDETAQIYVIPVDGGEAERVSNFAPGVGGFKWFPDGKRVAFIAWVWPELKGAKAQTKRLKEFNDRKTTGYVTSEAQYRFWDANLPMGRVAHLHVLDLASGRVTDLFEGSAYELPRADPDANAFDIAPDGRHIVFTHDTATEKRMDNPKVLVELQLHNGRFTPIAADAGHDFDAPRYSPDGQHIAMTCADIGTKHTMPNRLATTGIARSTARCVGRSMPARSGSLRNTGVVAICTSSSSRAGCRRWRSPAAG